MTDPSPPVRAWREMPEARLGDRFELLREIGCGGMGTVYRALDSTSGETVALKVILPGSAGDAARFARECEILAALSHPSIVRYVAHGETSDGEPWLAMEWLEGESLSRRVARGRLPWREAASIAHDVADALSVAHASGVIHRDLKPGNLFLVEGGVKVLDFGIARFRAPADGLTKTGQIIGTPGYMAPEQARSEKGITAAADVFSLGCVLYHLVAGEPPFEGDDVLSVLARLVLDEPVRLATRAPDAPPALEGLVQRMLAKSPDRRPTSATEVRDALDAVLRGELTDPRAEADTMLADARRESLPAPTWSEPASPAKRAAIALTAVAAVVASAWAAWALVDDDTGEARVEAAARAHPERADQPSRSSELTRACEAWATALAHAQRPDGSFGIERHREGWGWTTGQELLALARARGTCGTPDEETLRRGAAALERLRVEHGWGGAETRASTPAVAWAALAFAAVGEELDDDTLRTRAREARDLLIGAQHEDGALPFWMDGAGDELNAYSTILALWALADVAPVGEDTRARDARARATAWLRAALDGDPSGAAIRETAGMDEQAIWTLLRASGEIDRALLAASAVRIVARCRRAASGACERPLHENGEAYLDRRPGHGPNLVTLWRPWATASAARLAQVDALPQDRRASLRELAAWGSASMTRDVESMTIAPSYQLAEYLFVLTELAAR